MRQDQSFRGQARPPTTPSHLSEPSRPTPNDPVHRPAVHHHGNRYTGNASHTRPDDRGQGRGGIVPMISLSGQQQQQQRPPLNPTRQHQLASHHNPNRRPSAPPVHGSNDSIMKQIDFNMDAVKDALTCSICLDVYTDPVLIPDCGHTFCRACLLNTQKAGWTGCDICFKDRENIKDAFICHHHFRCPVCRSVLSYTSGEIIKSDGDPVMFKLVHVYTKLKKERPSLDRSEQTGQKRTASLLCREARAMKDVLSPFRQHLPAEMVGELDRVTKNLAVAVKGPRADADVRPLYNFILTSMIDMTHLNDQVNKIRKQEVLARLKRTGRSHTEKPRDLQVETDESMFEDEFSILYIIPLYRSVLYRAMHALGSRAGRPFHARPARPRRAMVPTSPLSFLQAIRQQDDGHDQQFVVPPRFFGRTTMPHNVFRPVVVDNNPTASGPTNPDHDLMFAIDLQLREIFGNDQ